MTAITTLLTLVHALADRGERPAVVALRKSDLTTWSFDAIGEPGDGRGAHRPATRAAVESGLRGGSPEKWTQPGVVSRRRTIAHRRTSAFPARHWSVAGRAAH